MDWNKIIRESLTRFMEDRRISKTSWSTRALGSNGSLRKLLEKEDQDIKISTLKRLADDQGVSLIDLMTYSLTPSLDVLMARLKTASVQEEGESPDMKGEALIIVLLQQILATLRQQETNRLMLDASPSIASSLERSSLATPHRKRRSPKPTGHH